MVSQEKWDKTKGLLKELTNMLTKGPLPLQRMLEIRGFLMYVVRTYVTRAPNPSGEFNCYYSTIFTLPRKSYRILVTVKYYLETFL